MTIRKAVRSDSAEWLRMRLLLWPDDEDEHSREIAAYFNGSGRDVLELLVLERQPGALAGFIELNIRNYAEGAAGSKVPYIEGWFVDADLRGRGLGGRLIRAAERWALERGFSELASDAEIDNTGSIAAHKALGFEETDRVVCFLKRLE